MLDQGASLPGGDETRACVGLTPLLGEGRVRQLQGEVGPTTFRHLVVSRAPDGAGKYRPLRAIFAYSPRPV
jgi:hypothetical protein